MSGRNGVAGLSARLIALGAGAAATLAAAGVMVALSWTSLSQDDIELLETGGGGGQVAPMLWPYMLSAIALLCLAAALAGLTVVLAVRTRPRRETGRRAAP